MNIFKKLLVVVALALLAGCGATGGGAKSGGAPKGGTVEERALARWNLLVARDGAGAYEYLTPGYRSTHPKEVYAAAMSSRPVKWTKAEFLDKECPDADTCTVRLVISFELRMAAGVGTVSSIDMQKEKWIRIKGEWYHLPAK
jgi:hypothetical protein